MFALSFQNVGAINRNIVTIGTMQVWYSYATPVAFVVDGETVCIENEWGTTTGKMLNQLEPDHSKRLDRAEFSGRLNTAFDKQIRLLALKLA